MGPESGGAIELAQKAPGRAREPTPTLCWWSFVHPDSMFPPSDDAMVEAAVGEIFVLGRRLFLLLSQMQ